MHCDSVGQPTLSSFTTHPILNQPDQPTLPLPNTPERENSAAPLPFTANTESLPQPTVGVQLSTPTIQITRKPLSGKEAFEHLKSQYNKYLLCRVRQNLVTPERALHLFQKSYLYQNYCAFVPMDADWSRISFISGKDLNTSSRFVRGIENATITELFFYTLDDKIYVSKAGESRLILLEDFLKNTQPASKSYFELDFNHSLEAWSFQEMMKNRKTVKEFLGHDLAILEDRHAKWADEAIQKQDKKSYFIRPSTSDKQAITVIRHIPGEKLRQDRMKMLVDFKLNEIYFYFSDDPDYSEGLFLVNTFLEGFNPIQLEQPMKPLSFEETRSLVKERLGLLESVHGSPVDERRLGYLFNTHIERREKDYAKLVQSSPHLLPIGHGALILNEGNQVHFVCVARTPHGLRMHGVYVEVESQKIQFFKDPDSNRFYVGYANSNDERKFTLEEFFEGIKFVDSTFFEASKLEPTSKLTKRSEKINLPQVKHTPLEKAKEALGCLEKNNFFIFPQETGKYLLVINRDGQVEEKPLTALDDPFNQELYFHFTEENRTVLAQEAIKGLKPIFDEDWLLYTPETQIGFPECFSLIESSKKCAVNFLLQELKGRPFVSVEQARGLLKSPRIKDNSFFICQIFEAGKEVTYLMMKKKAWVMQDPIESYAVNISYKKFTDEIVFQPLDGSYRETFPHILKTYQPLGEKDLLG